jgi:hypothetical protein
MLLVISGAGPVARRERSDAGNHRRMPVLEELKRVRV